MRWMIPAAALLAAGSIGVPAEAAPLTSIAGSNVERSAPEQAHYRRHRHHRHYRYYRRPGVHFYIAPRHHRHWRHRHHRHHRHW
jgi:hypothetical protein